MPSYDPIDDEYESQREAEFLAWLARQGRPLPPLAPSDAADFIGSALVRSLARQTPLLMPAPPSCDGDPAQAEEDPF